VPSNGHALGDLALRLLRKHIAPMLVAGSELQANANDDDRSCSRPSLPVRVSSASDQSTEKAGTVSRTRGLVVSAALAALITVIPASGAFANGPSSGHARSVLGMGQRLRAGQFRQSPNGRYRLLMRRDGDLAVYNRRNRHVLWSTGTDGHSGAFTAFQTDGNLVVYSRANGPLYASATTASPGARLVIQNDGNLVLYSAADRPLWSSKDAVFQMTGNQKLLPGESRRSSDGRFVLIMQDDGNLVLYGKGSGALWSSQTVGFPGAWAALQPDGQLVVRSASGSRVLFSSGATGAGRVRLDVGVDGNVGIYSGNGTPVWSTNWDVSHLSTGQFLFANQSRRSVDGRFLLSMQVDGNLVLYRVRPNTHQPLWSSGTEKHPGAWAVFNRDGNLVVVAPSGQPLFATGTMGGARSYLNVQPDGNVVIYSPTNAPLWATGTGGAP
jgi:hypothetical protein